MACRSAQERQDLQGRNPDHRRIRLEWGPSLEVKHAGRDASPPRACGLWGIAASEGEELSDSLAGAFPAAISSAAGLSWTTSNPAEAGPCWWASRTAPRPRDACPVR